MAKDKSGNWFKRHKVLTVIGSLIVLGIIISASSSHGSTGLSTTPTTTTQAKAATPAPTVAHVGSTVNIGGDQGLAATLVQVIDPATASSQYASADAGKHFVGTKFQLTNKGSASYSDNANTDVTVIGSDNQSYTADFNTIDSCTDFSSGSFTLGAGASATGCVTFQLPNGVTVAKVQFATQSGFSGSTGEWVNP